MKTVFDTIFLGAGPAGTGPLLCALRRGDHPALLARGMLWIDRSDHMVAGTIGNHDILSDTAGSVLLECLRDHAAAPLAQVMDSPEADEVRRYASGPLPLTVAGRFLRALGGALRRIVDASGTSAFLPNTEVTRVEQRAREFVVDTVASDGTRCAFRARRVVFAMGGVQRRDALLDAPLAGALRLRHDFETKTVTSAELVTPQGLAAFAARLRDRVEPHVVVLGGSHSAMTAAWLALHRTGANFGKAGVEMYCRRTPKVFYPTRRDAALDRYLDWDDDDVCPVTGRVFRLAGLRFNSRELMRSVSGLGDAPAESRLKIVVFDSERDEARLRAALTRADAIVVAFGYRPRLVPLICGGRSVLDAVDTGRGPLVDGRCRVLDGDGAVVPDAYGIGLAAGFVPDGDLGGEPSFDGQTNGLWLYQNGVGERILDQLMSTNALDQARAEDPGSAPSVRATKTLSAAAAWLPPHDAEELRAAEQVAAPQPTGFVAETEEPFETGP